MMKIIRNKYPFTNLENSLGVIYIVRDPRNVITSLKHHYSWKDYDEAFKMMASEHTWLEDEDIRYCSSGFIILG